MKIHDDKSEIISKKDYSFIIRYNNTRNNQKNETLIINQYKLSIENISNTFLAITLYEIRKKLDITKYSNKLPINYFLEKSSLLRLLSLISKNTFNIQNIFNIIIKVINSEIASNSNYLIYNKKYMNFKINKLIDDDKNDIILLKFYIILANLQKEEIDIELIKKKKLY